MTTLTITTTSPPKKIISEFALWRRLQRRLAERRLKLSKIRDGGWLLIDTRRGEIVRCNIDDLEEFAHQCASELKLPILRPWETTLYDDNGGKGAAIHA